MLEAKRVAALRLGSNELGCRHTRRFGDYFAEEAVPVVADEKLEMFAE